MCHFSLVIRKNFHTFSQVKIGYSTVKRALLIVNTRWTAAHALYDRLGWVNVCFAIVLLQLIALDFPIT